ncbi:putative adhesin [Streptomyces sp. 2333.5]|nr:putative adhesin [Streptomyces sp. 2333.5]SED60751.1 Putative adhesin [Streptomyces sp. 2314.4]SEE28127.1 Putative adhesin [Streptomyces sp. 2112.2]
MVGPCPAALASRRALDGRTARRTNYRPLPGEFMRMRVRFTAVVATAGIGMCGLSACGLVPGKTFRDDAEVAKKITSIRLDNTSGGLTVHGGKAGGAVSVHRSVTYHGDRPQGATHRIEDGVLVLGGCGEHCTVDYTVQVPAGLPVSGETADGGIDLSGVGAVQVTTSNGGIDLDGVTGPIDATTTDGAITGHGLSGRQIAAETSNGAIDLTPATAQSVRAKTSNGSITVTVPKAHYRVSAETSNGDKHLGVVQDPAGRYRLDLTTSNGDITAKSA